MDPTLHRLANTAPIHKALPLPALALATVVSKDGMSVYASSDTWFKGAVFGRDSLEVAEDLMDLKPALVHNILLTMGKLQGIGEHPQTEEQPGKIIHEYRTTTLNGKPIGKKSREIFDMLVSKRGGTDTEFTYYGSIDATPHFLRTLGRYCDRYGMDILDETVVQRNGETVSMRQVASNATKWLLRELDASGSGMLEWMRKNPQGLPNQVWKDSEEFYVHDNGEMANHDKPLTSIEVQGLTYDALMSAVHLFPKNADVYKEKAYAVRDTTINTLWMPRQNFFALGTDYAPDSDELRVIRTITGNPAALLDTDIFTDLPDEDRQKYVSGIVNRITAKDFLTSAGIRSRSLDFAHVVDKWDYHGSYVTWPKETYDIAKGLKRQGFPKLSRQLENRLLNIVLKTREYPEFVYVDGWGRVLTGQPRKQLQGKTVAVEGHDQPEKIQAWTVSALMAIVSGRGVTKLQRRRHIVTEQWQHDLETRILSRIPHIDLHLNPVKLWLQYPTYKYQLAQSKDIGTI